MATVIFDFDSTLITCESLEAILSNKALSQETMEEIRQITNQGMSGALPFLDSLQKRMHLATLYKQDFIDFGRTAAQLLTPGIAALIHKLKSEQVDIWIISGAVREAMLPVGAELAIPPEKILGIDLIWSREGAYEGIDLTKPINHSKWQGAQTVSKQWLSPKIAVGDGITDYALYEQGLTDHFIAFTQNVRRQAVIDKGAREAKTMVQLRQLLQKVIDG